MYPADEVDKIQAMRTPAILQINKSNLKANRSNLHAIVMMRTTELTLRYFH